MPKKTRVIAGFDQTQAIIDKLGGLMRFTYLMGYKSVSTVQHWQKAGYIPNKYHPKIVDIMVKEEVYIDPLDFVHDTRLRKMLGANK